MGTKLGDLDEPAKASTEVIKQEEIESAAKHPGSPPVGNVPDPDEDDLDDLDGKLLPEFYKFVTNIGGRRHA